MVSAAEASGQQVQMDAMLDQGVRYISADKEVQFRLYNKRALLNDGSVFWVATDEYAVVKGSLHYGTERYQDQDQTIGVNQVMLTSTEQITQLNVVSPDTMWIGDWPIQEDAPPLKIAFSSRGSFYRQAEVWHYSGFAVFPIMLSQLIDDASDLPAGPIVSNSLPIWLLLTDFAGMTVPVYPSYLVPDNIPPPYIAVHIPSDVTESLAAAPYLVNSGQTVSDDPAPLYAFNVSTPARDNVELVLFGFSSQMAWQYLQMLIDSSIDGTAAFGFANSPIPQDPKQKQSEIATLAQKKIIQIVANYQQGAADAAARRYILEASISSVTINGGLPAFGKGALTQDSQFIFGEGEVFE